MMKGYIIETEAGNYFIGTVTDKIKVSSIPEECVDVISYNTWEVLGDKATLGDKVRMIDVSNLNYITILDGAPVYATYKPDKFILEYRN